MTTRDFIGNRRAFGSAESRFLVLACAAAAAVAAVAVFALLSRNADDGLDLPREYGKAAPSVCETPEWETPEWAGGRSNAPPPAPAPDRPRQGGKRTVSGIVTDSSGSPVGGAKVVLAPVSAPEASAMAGPIGYVSSILDYVERGAEIPWPSAMSLASGRFSMSNVEPGEHYVLVSHRRFRRFVDLVDVPRSEDLKIRLESGLAVAGIVLDSDGKGASGIEVAGFQKTVVGEMEYTTPVRTVTGQDGVFTLDGFDRGTVSVALVIPSGAEIIGVDAKIREVQAGDAGVLFRIIRLGFVEFSALLRATGGPIAGIITAELEDPSAFPDLSAFLVLPVDQQAGLFMVKAPPGTWKLRFHCMGFGSATAAISATAAKTSRLEEPLRFGGLSSLTGSVTAGDQGPAASVFVFIEREHTADPFTAFARTDRDGVFRFMYLPEGLYRIVALKQGHRAAQIRRQVAGDVSAGIVLEQGSGPSGFTSYAYRQRKKLRISIESTEFTIEDFALWLSEISSVRISVSGQVAEAFKTVGTLINLSMHDIPLDHVIRMVAGMHGVVFDEETACFVPGK